MKFKGFDLVRRGFVRCIFLGFIMYIVYQKIQKMSLSLNFYHLLKRASQLKDFQNGHVTSLQTCSYNHMFILYLFLSFFTEDKQKQKQ